MRQVMAEFVEEFATAATAVDARPTAVMARFRRAQTAITSFSRPDNGAGVTVSKVQFEAWYRAKCVEAVEDPVCPPNHALPTAGWSLTAAFAAWRL